MLSFGSGRITRRNVRPQSNSSCREIFWRFATFWTDSWQWDWDISTSLSVRIALVEVQVKTDFTSREILSCFATLRANCRERLLPLSSAGALGKVLRKPVTPVVTRQIQTVEYKCTAQNSEGIRMRANLPVSSKVSQSANRSGSRPVSQLTSQLTRPSGQSDSWCNYLW